MGSAYDARQALPSQSVPSQPAAGGGGAPQYKPYVPPGGIDGPSAPTPNDYYRSNGVY
jgi:signal transducing adaptor molecule